MFTIREDRTPSRRAFLRVGAFGLGALGLPGLLHGNRAVQIGVESRQVLSLSLGGLIADQFAVTTAIEDSLELISSSRDIKVG